MTPAQRDLLICEFGRRLKLPYPMGLAEMLEEALEVYRKNFAILFGLALVPAIIGTVLETISSLLRTIPLGKGYEPLFIATMVVSYILLIITAFIGYGAQIWAAGRAIMGRSVGLGEAWMAVLKRSGALLLTMFLAFLPTIAGLVLCCVGIFFTATVFVALIEQVVLLEGIAYNRAISRHVQLVYPNWEWARVLGFYLASYLIVMVVQTLIGWGGMMSLFGLEISREVFPLSTWLVFLIAGQLWLQLANALVMPYLSVFITLLYFDLRARREAFDVQVLIERWETLGH